MKGEEWQVRAKRAGLTQRALAELLGHTENTVSRQLRGDWESGVPQHVMAAIVAWELMDANQRTAWLKAMSANKAKRTKSPKAQKPNRR